MDVSGIILLVLLAVMVVFMFLASRRQRKAQEEQLQKLNELKEGDKVRTYTGIYATIKKLYDSTDGKIAVLEIGEGKNTVCFEMEVRMIVGLDTKTEVTFNEEETNANSNEEKIEQAEIEQVKEEIKEKLEDENKKYSDENTGTE